MGEFCLLNARLIWQEYPQGRTYDSEDRWSSWRQDETNLRDGYRWYARKTHLRDWRERDPWRESLRKPWNACRVSKGNVCEMHTDVFEQCLDISLGFLVPTFKNRTLCVYQGCAKFWIEELGSFQLICWNLNWIVHTP